jgi:hypothetical protein
MQYNDTNNNTLAFRGQDLLIRVQLVFAPNVTIESCYPLLFQFNIVASSPDAAYFTDAFVINTGENFMCLRSKALPILSR